MPLTWWVVVSDTRRSGSVNGSGRIATVSTTLKIVLLTPIPRAMHATVRAANPGFFTSVRAAYRRSCSNVSIRHLDGRVARKFCRIRRMKIRLSFCAFAAVALVSTNAAARPLALEDYYRIVGVQAPAMSPDGRFVAFIRSTIVEAEKDRKSVV